MGEYDGYTDEVARARARRRLEERRRARQFQALLDRSSFGSRRHAGQGIKGAHPAFVILDEAQDFEEPE